MIPAQFDADPTRRSDFRLIPASVGECLRFERMKKSWWSGLFLLAVTVPGWAQKPASWEIFGGYQYTRADFGVIQDTVRALNAPYGRPDATAPHTLTLTGGTLSLQKNFSPRWAGMIDFGGAFGPIDVDLSPVMLSLGYIPHGTTYTSTMEPTVYTLTAGPQFNLKKIGQTQIFARILGGGAQSQLKVDALTRNALNFLAPTYATRVNSPAAIMGIGLQHPVFRQFDLRASADYVITFFGSNRESYIRVSAGVVLRRPGRLW